MRGFPGFAFGLTVFTVICPLVCPALVVEWEQHYHITAGIFPLNTPARNLIREANGNLSVVGTTFNATNNTLDVTVIKYDSNGTLLWAAIWGSDTDDESGESAAFDPEGNVCVLVTRGRYTSNPRPMLIKCDATNGEVLWEIFAAEPDVVDIPRQIRVDAVGNIYTVFIAGSDIEVAKFDTHGSNLWRRVIHSEGAGGFPDLEVDRAGFVHVTGLPFLTCKLDPTGTVLWQKSHVIPQSDHLNQSSDLTLDPSGNVYVTGSSSEKDASGFSRSYISTVKYSPTGKKLWAARYCGPLNWESRGEKVEVDPSGYVYVAGNAGPHTVLLKYSPSGRHLWTSRYWQNSAPHSLLLDDQSNAYIAAYRFGSATGTSEDIPLLKLDRNGNRVWIAHYRGSDSPINLPAGLTMSSPDQLQLAATSSGISTTNIFIATISFRQTDSPAAPRILVQPRSTFVKKDGTAVFRVIASGEGELAYQRFFNESPLTGHTNAQLVLTEVQPDLNGSIWVTVSNAHGMVVSPEVQLKVRFPTPVVQIQVRNPVVQESELSRFPILTLSRSSSADNPELGVLIDFSGTADRDDYWIDSAELTYVPNVKQVFFGAGELVKDIQLQPVKDFNNEDQMVETIRATLKPSFRYSYRIGRPSKAEIVILDR